MTHSEALKLAEEIITKLIKSGNEAIFEAARGADGRIDKMKLAMACASATNRLANEFMGVKLGNDYKIMWAKRTEKSPWEYFVVVGDKHFIDGTLCEPYDFWEIRRTAFRSDYLQLGENP